MFRHGHLCLTLMGKSTTLGRWKAILDLGFQPFEIWIWVFGALWNLDLGFGTFEIWILVTLKLKFGLRKMYPILIFFLASLRSAPLFTYNIIVLLEYSEIQQWLLRILLLASHKAKFLNKQHIQNLIIHTSRCTYMPAQQKKLIKISKKTNDRLSAKGSVNHRHA